MYLHLYIKGKLLLSPITEPTKEDYKTEEP